MDRNLRSAPSPSALPLAPTSVTGASHGIDYLRALCAKNEDINASDIVTAVQDARIRQAMAENVVLKDAALKAEASDRAKSDFLANMIHEIRTPMGAIIGLANLLGTAPLDEKQKQCLTMLKSCAEDLIDMISGSLDIDRIESRIVNLDNAPFNMRTLLQNIADTMAVTAIRKNIGVTLHCAPAFSPLFVADSGRIRQIVTNLVGNAIKFTETGGVTISCAAEQAADGKNHISIAIADIGIGIPAEKMGVVFDRFVQADPSIARKFGGSGLGLSISKALAESMGGTLTATSIAGTGSTFTLRLQLSVPRHI